mmetsp:Transcript_15278/g.46170  ORF Transcript_15278/g.46170 Transcript_15278/m.46170 type:complete len:222 (-) Transcript_15278:657-1322(-)
MVLACVREINLLLYYTLSRYLQVPYEALLPLADSSVTAIVMRRLLSLHHLPPSLPLPVLHWLSGQVCLLWVQLGSQLRQQCCLLVILGPAAALFRRVQRLHHIALQQLLQVLGGMLVLSRANKQKFAARIVQELRVSASDPAAVPKLFHLLLRKLRLIAQTSIWSWIGSVWILDRQHQACSSGYAQLRLHGARLLRQLQFVRQVCGARPAITAAAAVAATV